jgi:hypothetical protein
MTYPNYTTGQPVYKQALPSAQTVLVLGILSLVFMLCCGVIGLALAIVAAVLGSQGKKLYAVEMAKYTAESYNQLKAGHTMAWISIGLNIASTIILIILMATGHLLSK